jgi:hypothetical protein
LTPGATLRSKLDSSNTMTIWGNCRELRQVPADASFKWPVTAASASSRPRVKYSDTAVTPDRANFDTYCPV